MSATATPAASAASAPTSALEQVKKLIAEVPILIFSGSQCKYSAAAKRLLMKYHPLMAPAIQVVEIDVMGGATLFPEADYRSALTSITNSKTTPQLFFNGQYIGGFDDMNRLHEGGALEPKLKQADQAYDKNKSYGKPSLITVVTKKDYASVCSSVSSTTSRFKYGNLNSLDMMALLQSRGQKDMHTPITVFDVCNPGHAFSVLSKHPSVSTALPCRISVWRDEQAGVTVIQTIRPHSIVGMFDAEGLKQVAEQVEGDLCTIMLQLC